MNDKNEQSPEKPLDPHKDAYIVIKFSEINSAMIDLHPYNVSPIQMILAGHLLIHQGQEPMNKEIFKQAIREVNRENPILVPNARLPRNNA